MKITNALDGEIILRDEGITARRIFSVPELQAIHMTLDPGARIDTHTNDVDVLFYIIEGEALVEIAEEQKRSGRDCIIECPRDLPRALENSGKTDVLRVLVIKKIPVPSAGGV